MPQLLLFQLILSVFAWRKGWMLAPILLLAFPWALLWAPEVVAGISHHAANLVPEGGGLVVTGGLSLVGLLVLAAFEPEG